MRSLLRSNVAAIPSMRRVLTTSSLVNMARNRASQRLQASGQPVVDGRRTITHGTWTSSGFTSNTSTFSYSTSSNDMSNVSTSSRSPSNASTSSHSTSNTSTSSHSTFNASTSSHSTSNASTSTTDRPKLKSIQDLPGPLHLPLVGTSWMYWWLGPYNRHTFHQADVDLYRQHGPIYRERRGRVPMVSIHRAGDIERVFRGEGRYPNRVVNEALVHKRRKQPHLYPTVGLAEAEGEDWYQLRRQVGPTMLRPAEASQLLGHVDLASQALLEALQGQANGGALHLPDLAHWTVRYGAEAIWQVVLGRQLGALRPVPPPEAAQLSSMALRQFTLMAELRLSSGWWRLWPELFPKYRQFARLDEAVHRLATRHTAAAWDNLAAEGGQRCPFTGTNKGDFSSQLHSTTSNPASTTSNPASTTSNPASTSSNLASTTSNHASTTSNPASTTSNPASTTSNPAFTTSNPASTTSNPASTTSNPASTTSNPAFTSSNPASTTFTPSSTADRASTTSTPAFTTSNPASTTSSPASTSSNPAFTTSTPSSTADRASTTSTTIMQKFSQLAGLDRRDANTIIMDFISAGVTTTASTLVLLLHRLGQEPSVVRSLQHELDRVMGGPETGPSLSQGTLDSLPYLKAVVMEGYRLTPIIPSIIRILPQDIELAGYRIPANTPIIAKTRAACLDEANFARPLEFLPERWLPSRHATDPSSAPLREQARRQRFLVMPFGFGARMCVGARLAEYKLYAALIKILLHFDVSSSGSVKLGNFLFLAPLHPVPVTLTPRRGP